ncbi:MAG: hypothetical protein M0015_14895 [Betaproteobacteria bacterium]|nr:hypothetical protein [Betaproteobacteria bacterium]
MNLRPAPLQSDRIAVERARIDFLVQRDGLGGAAQWVRHTIGIYRRAVLDRQHYASRPEYRRGFIQSYCAFKAWLGCVAASSNRMHATAHE